jgi:adenine-specific DNA-methyltransferase
MDLVDQFLIRTEQRRVESLASIGTKTRASLGQFFTPGRAADLIASMVMLPETGALRILDPGAGSGSLTAALVARVLREAPQLSLEVVALEIDNSVAGVLRDTLVDATATAARVGTEISTSVVIGDFIHIAEELGSEFDVVIMNPPYAKIRAGSAHKKAMAARGVDAGNLYAAFLALSAIALKPGGKLVAITPRSFTNGPYFAQFRGFLLDRVALDRIHIFASRATVFSDTGVLQEIIIIAGTRAGETSTVTLASSTGHEDEFVEQEVAFSQIVHEGDPARFIRIPSADGAHAAVELMLSLPASLADLGVKVSTGRVVDFRSRDNLVEKAGPENFPMVYPANLKSGEVIHPLANAKPQRFCFVLEKDARLLVPAGTYVLIKRFSAKEERRRIVAGIWADCTIPVAFDNKLNYIHADGAGLDTELAVGLSIWLNSTLVDTAFRTFSGHTQVNATDLRSMRFPSADMLRALGAGRSAALPTQGEIDEMVAGILKFAVAA